MFKKHGILFLFALILFYSCETTPDKSIWPPDTSNDAPRPTIERVEADPTTIDKDGVTFAGIGIINIIGTNFSANPQENRVYFNGTPGTILSANTTSLKVKVPTLISDSIAIQVGVQGALQYAAYNGKNYYSPFKTKNAIFGYLAIDQNIDASGLAVDKEDNVYVLTTGKKILKLSAPDSDAVVYGTTSLIVTPDMHFGPDGSLFITRGTRSIYTIPPGGGAASRYVSAKSNVSFIDFDANQNLYAAGKGGDIQRIKQDKTILIVADYSDYYINALRIYNGYVYVAAEYKGTDSTQIAEGIWKNKINDPDSSLGENELILNWHDKFPDGLIHITALTFDENGKMFIGQNEGNAVYLLQDDAYLYPEILFGPAGNLTWGNGNFLYMNFRSEDGTKRTIQRIELLNRGAIYNGRPN